MKHKAIMEIYPTVKRVVETIDGVITAFDENNNQVNVNMSAVETKANELQALENVYVNRRKEYGNWESQLDEIYHEGLDSWKTRIASIKTKYPKE